MRLEISATTEILRFLEDVGEATDQESVDFDYLEELITANADRGVILSELVAGSEVVQRRRPQETGLSEMELLRRKEGEKAYQRTAETVSVIKERRRQTDKQDTFKDSHPNLVLACNTTLGFFLMFIAGYHVARFGGAREELRLIIGGCFSLGGLLLEVAMLMLYDYHYSRYKTAKAKRDRRLEARALVGTKRPLVAPAGPSESVLETDEVSAGAARRRGAATVEK